MCLSVCIMYWANTVCVTCEWLAKYIFIIKQQWLNWLRFRLEMFMSATSGSLRRWWCNTMSHHRRLITVDDVGDHHACKHLQKKGFSGFHGLCHIVIETKWSSQRVSFFVGCHSFGHKSKRKWSTPSHASHTFSSFRLTVRSSLFHVCEIY